MALQLLSRSRKAVSDKLRFVMNSPSLFRCSVIPTQNTPNLPCLIPKLAHVGQFRTYGSYENDNTPIKVVCRFDLNAVGPQACEENWGKVLRRFPLLYPKDEGSSVRRTVCDVRDKAFAKNRHFLFIDVGCDGLDVQLLYCTKTTDMIGVKGLNRMVVFRDDPFLHSAQFQQLAGLGVDVDRFYYHHLIVPCYPNKLIPDKAGFKDAVNGVMDVLGTVAWDYEEREHFEDCLGLLYCFTFGGMQFEPTKMSMLSAVKSGGRVWDDEDKGGGKMLSKYWDKVSLLYLDGARLWNNLFIDEKIAVIKYSQVVIEAGSLKGSRQRESLRQAYCLRMELEFAERIKRKPDRIQRAARDAWNEAKGGFDEDEFFEEKGFKKDEEKAAREAWRTAIQVYTVEED